MVSTKNIFQGDAAEQHGMLFCEYLLLLLMTKIAGWSSEIGYSKGFAGNVILERTFFFL